MRTLRLGCWLLLAVVGMRAQETMPDWQKAAGGKMAFDVATVRVSAPGTFSPPSFPLSADDSYKNTGGEFSADFPIGVYINFAYKLPFGQEQAKAMKLIPKEIADAHFTIHAKGPATATKDQMRLMVQDLLRERFGLKAHYEARESDVLELTTKKPGVTGPKLIPHSQGPKCVDEGGEPTVTGAFPPMCATYVAMLKADHLVHMGARDTTLELMAWQMFPMGRLGKTVVDRTGLTGRWDVSLEFAPDPGSMPPPPNAAPGSATDAAPQGPTFLEAVDDQLGLKLKPGKASMQVLVIDHIEMPSGN